MKSNIVVRLEHGYDVDLYWSWSFILIYLNLLYASVQTNGVLTSLWGEMAFISRMGEHQAFPMS